MLLSDACAAHDGCRLPDMARDDHHSCIMQCYTVRRYSLRTSGAGAGHARWAIGDMRTCMITSCGAHLLSHTLFCHCTALAEELLQQVSAHAVLHNDVHLPVVLESSEEGGDHRHAASVTGEGSAPEQGSYWCNGAASMIQLVLHAGEPAGYPAWQANCR